MLTLIDGFELNLQYLHDGDRPLTSVPDISVVMSTYNGAKRLRRTIECLLAQDDVNLELIVINDGSTDESPLILDSCCALDSRIRPVHRQNGGLTDALHVGSALARGEYIARQDVGDFSLANRLQVQARFLANHPQVVAVGSGIRWIGPEGEYLGEWVRHQAPEETTRELIDSGVGFVHPSVMFRRDAYEKAGGYRTQFRFAQDHDLWYRMAEHGLLATCPEVLFEYRMDVSGISPQNRARQKRLGELARECYFARKSGRRWGMAPFRLHSFAERPWLRFN